MWPSVSKLIYMNSESYKFEVRMRSLSLYRMSEEGVYPSSVLPVLSEGSRIRTAVSDPILGVEVARCSIGVIRGVK